MSITQTYDCASPMKPRMIPPKRNRPQSPAWTADAYGRSWTESHCNCRRKLQYAEQRKHRAISTEKRTVVSEMRCAKG